MEVNQMADRIRAVQFGCGPIGCAVAKLASQRPDIEIVGAVDIDKNKVGKDLGEIIGIDKKLGVAITDDMDSLFAKIGRIHVEAFGLQHQLNGCSDAGVILN